MHAWQHVVDEAPDLARRVQERFETHGLGYLATLRADGSPRISGVEPLFANDELWLGMMPDSRKAQDLHRDTRCTLHSANVDKDVTEGDAKVSGHAVEVFDHDQRQAYVEAVAAIHGVEPEMGPFHLFRIAITEVVFIIPTADKLVIESWHDGRGSERVEKS